jgi:hypothetical protein
MTFWIMLAFTVFFVMLIYKVIKAIIQGGNNVPTWRGIIISAMLGVLPLYLFLCWIGKMGETR